MSEAFLRVKDTLDSHGSQSRDVRQNHAMYQCPAHEDRNPSLSVDDKGDKVAVYCHAGCDTTDVLAAIGMELRELFDGEFDETDRDRSVPIRSYVYNSSQGEPRYIVDRYFPKTFRGRRPDTLPGDTSGIKGIDPILYHADVVWQCLRLADSGCTVWLVDGEKDVETCERHGLIATCPPGFGKRWREDYTKFLRRAKEVIIVADQDLMKPNGELGKGQAFAVEARKALRAAGVKVRVVAPAVGKDATDHFTAGYGPEDFVPEPTAYTRPRGMRANDLMGKEFQPVPFAVEKVLPSGLTIFAGSPKAGKSWVSLYLCLAVAAGGPALSSLRANQGSCLYLAREDTYRRLQSRIALLTSGTMEAPQALEIIPAEQEWIGGEEGLANMTEWAEEVGNPRLVVLDTLAKIEPDMGEEQRRGAYAGNYSMMARYKSWADTHDCAVLVVHHDRKTATGRDGGTKEDPFTRISGTRGLTGAADTLWFLESIRGEGRGELHITGRDVVEQSIDLYKSGPIWCASHQPE